MPSNKKTRPQFPLSVTASMPSPYKTTLILINTKHYLLPSPSSTAPWILVTRKLHTSVQPSIRPGPVYKSQKINSKPTSWPYFLTTTIQKSWTLYRKLINPSQGNTTTRSANHNQPPVFDVGNQGIMPTAADSDLISTTAQPLVHPDHSCPLLKTNNKQYLIKVN
jgi:hypothetical protein